MAVYKYITKIVSINKKTQLYNHLTVNSHMSDVNKQMSFPNWYEFDFECYF